MQSRQLARSREDSDLHTVATLLAGFQALLGRYAGQDDVTVGSCTSNGTSCVYTAGWTTSQLTCSSGGTFVAGCLGSGTDCNASFAASSDWGCH